MKLKLNKIKTNCTEQGFSLVELLISLLILAMVVTGIVATLPNAYRNITVSGRVSTMTHLANTKLEELRSKAAANWGDTDLTVGSHPAVAADRMITGYNGYSITWEVVDGPVSGTMKSVVVEAGFLIYQSDGTSLAKIPTEARTQRFFTMLAQ
jgi:prepilin-type N-terminal cleavage/methylation domain-containing protein